MRMRSAGAALAATAMLVSCAPRPAPPAPAPPPPSPAPAPPPPPAVPPPSDWTLAPLSSGDWRMSGDGAAAAATFEGGAGPVFRIACAGPGRVSLSAPAAPGGALSVRTSYGERALNAAELPAADPLLDQMAFSRGRFLVRTAGAGDLVLPAWPEPAWVIEQCRGA